MQRVGSRRRRLAGCLFLLVWALVPSQSWAEAAATAPCDDVLSVEPMAVATLSLDPHEVDALRNFYRGRGDRCAWPAAKILSLRAVLSRAGDQGLDVARYRPDLLDPGRGTLSDTARDLFASAMALRYARDMMFGRVDLHGIETDIDVRRPADDLTAQLDAALAQPDIAPWLAGLAPSAPAYRRLVEAYRRYRDRPDAADTDPIAAGGPLRLGATGPRVAALKARLRRLGDLRDGADDTRFDASAKAALAAFQRRHGIAGDGKLTRETLAALNLPDAERLRQLVLNLERWRYFGHVLAATRIEVNIAAATVQFIENGRVGMAMRAVVGDRKHESPTLVSPALDAIVLNPTWHVPVSIVEKEIEPRLAREPDYLERNDMHWDNGHLLQASGARNSLGRIKFDFPSPFAVYLHDTPSHNLFARQNRALSHGCIRVELPRELALKLLASQENWTPERLKTAIDGGATRIIAVPDGPQVALVYWTAFVDEDGTVEFRPDPYGRDVKLEAALDRMTAPPRGAVRLAGVRK